MDQESTQPAPISTEPISSPTPFFRGLNPLLILSMVVLLIVVGTGGVLLGKSLNISQKSTPPTVTPTPLSSEVSTKEGDPTTNWKTYTNTKYGYSIKYPSYLGVKTGGYGLIPTEEESRIIVGDITPKDYYEGRLTIRAQNQDTCQNNAQELEILKCDLKSFAEWLWKLNKEDKNSNIINKKVSELTETTIAEEKAYQFTINGNWVDDSGGEVIDKEQLVVFVKNKEVVFTIRLTTNNKLYQQILSTFKFL